MYSVFHVLDACKFRIPLVISLVAISTDGPIGIDLAGIVFEQALVATPKISSCMVYVAQETSTFCTSSPEIQCSLQIEAAYDPSHTSNGLHV